MKITHRISVRTTSAIKANLILIGVEATGNHVVFEIEDGTPEWGFIEKHLADWGAYDRVSTTFTTDERDAAQWLELLPGWHHGYPQPRSGDFGYQGITYDEPKICGTCGCGTQQVAPFRMTREPKWGKRNVLQLNWIFDEYFVTPELWEGVFQQFGIGKRAVLDSTGDVELSTVVQLVIEDRVSVDAGGHPSATCATCGALKYFPVVRGRFPAPKTVPIGDAFKTVEYFGDGGSANHAVVVSQKLYRALNDYGANGVSYYPLENCSM